MKDFNIRSESVNVEQIMLQIRARIREKRGVDYTEEEIRELANVKLEKLLDPTKVRSDLVEHYRRQQPKQPPALPPLPALPPPAPAAAPFAPLEQAQPFLNYAFEDSTIYRSSRGLFGTLIGLVRTLLNPILKLFFNPNPIVHVLHLQSEINARYEAEMARHRQRLAEHEQRFGEDGQRLAEHEQRLIEHRDQLRHVSEMFTERDKMRVPLDALNYELLNNLVVEMTRLGIEVKNLKMRVESLSSRLDFDERRGRALEGVVQYKPGAVPPSQLAGGIAVSGEFGRQPQTAAPSQGDARRPRRRRRRGRRRGVGAEPGVVGGSPGSDMKAASVEPEPAPETEPEGGKTPEQ